MRINTQYVCMPGAFWSVDLDIYTISMSHDLRVSSLAAIIEHEFFTSLIQPTRDSKIWPDSLQWPNLTKWNRMILL